MRVEIPLLRLRQRPIGDVFPPVASVLVVDVEGEALRFFEHVKARDDACHQGMKGLTATNAAYTDDTVLGFGLWRRENPGKLPLAVCQNLIKKEELSAKRAIKRAANFVG